MKSLCIRCVFAIPATVFAAILAFAQSDLDKAPKPQQTKPAEKKAANETPAQSLTDAERKALRREDQSEEEAAILPYINNFFATTRLGPEDVISVDV
ncbi:MAG TPA: hypothetical protein PK012_34255, partial [Blastocatellia bacterium]|nr:hypothetical protein [Blastocatellia bacterium]